MYCELCGHFWGILEFWFFITDEGNERETGSYSYDPQPSLSGIHSYDFRHDIYGFKKKTLCFIHEVLTFIW